MKLGRRGYSALLYALSPLIWKRLAREQTTGATRAERLGHIPDYRDTPVLWVHAASVGEVVTAAPVIRQLLIDYPLHRVIVSTMTATGAAQVNTLFGDRVTHHFLPLDFPGAMKRFVARLSPDLLILAETELWPNMIHATAAHNVPIAMINARLSPKAFARYVRFHSLAHGMLIRVNWIAAKSGDDAKRFRSLGVSPTRLSVTGALKFDLAVDDAQRQAGAALRASIGPRPVWIAASTHEGEEQAALDAHAQLRKVRPDALLILVPRHPQRFDHVAELSVAAYPGRISRRSEQDAITPDTCVYLGDTMGELMGLYAASDVAFVGGSLVPIGGHNLLEPAALGVPVLSGPHLEHLQEIADTLAEHEARREVSDVNTLAQTLISLFTDETARRVLGEAGQRVVERNRGALARIRQKIHTLVPVDRIVQ